MSAVVFGYCKLDEINIYNLDLEDLIDIMLLFLYIVI